MERIVLPIFTRSKGMIHLSASAVTEVKRLQSKQCCPNSFFRLSIQAGGCSGLIYHMAFDANLTSGDRAIECNGISIVLDPQSLVHIENLSIDYSEDLMGGGFRFHNAKAIATCSCGNSFAVDPQTTTLAHN